MQQENQPRNHQSEATKRAKNNRRKGSSFERDCVVFFSQWTGFEFSRTPSSGAGIIKGDVMPVIGTNFPFLIECKRVASYKLDSILEHGGTLWSAWLKAESETPKGHHTILCVARSRIKPMIILKLSTLIAFTNLRYADVSVQNFATIVCAPYGQKKGVNDYLIAVRMEDLLRFPYKRID